MPSGPKKRKGAKKKKALEHAAPDVQECVDFEHVADKVESIDQSTMDSALTVEAADLPAPEILDSKINEGQDEDHRPANVASLQPLPLPLQEDDSSDKTTEIVFPTNAASEEKQDFLSYMEQLERLRRTVIEVVQATENMTTLVHKLLDDLNNFQLTAGQ